MEKIMKQKKIWIGAAVGITLLVVLIVAIAALGGGKEPSYRSIKIVELKGNVSIERGGIGTLAAAENMNLVSGDRVATAEEAYVVLCLDTDKYVMLGEAGAMKIVAEGDGNSGKTLISLESGSVLNDIRNPLGEGSSYEIATPNATMSVRGTVFEVENEGDGQISVLVYDGKVAVELDGKEPVLYNAGEYTVFTDSTAPEVLVDRGTISGDVIDENVRERLQQISTEGRPLNVGSADLGAAGQADSVPMATPEATEIPVAASTPAPAATPIVTVTPAPAVTATPASTETPVVTATPAPTATPVVTATPAPTATPTVTATPVPTARPAVTATPAPVSTPAVTAAPASTATPMMTETPVPEPEEKDEEEPEPTAEPTPAPTKEPIPTIEPTPAPTKEPRPTAEPTSAPTKEPEPTAEPTPAPTKEPEPTAESTPVPTKEPESTVVPWPTFGPWWPTAAPTAEPTATPTIAPTAAPTAEPTATPTIVPTAAPTAEPTATPTIAPTAAPTAEPTAMPTIAPTAEPTATPTIAPTAAPTATPAPPQEGYCVISYEVPYVLISGKEPENAGEAAGITTALAYGSSTVKKGDLLPWKQDKPEVTSIPNHGDVQGLGLEFVGWYKANGFEWIFATDVAMEDTVLYPVWKDKDGNLYKVKVSKELGVCYSIKVPAATPSPVPSSSPSPAPSSEPSPAPSSEPSPAPSSEPTGES